MSTHVDDVRVRAGRNIPISIVRAGVQHPPLLKLDIYDVVAGLELDLQRTRAAKGLVWGSGPEGGQLANFDDAELEGDVDLVLDAAV